MADFQNPWMDPETMAILGLSMIGSIQPRGYGGGNFAQPAINAWMQNKRLAEDQAWRERKFEADQAWRETQQQQWERDFGLRAPYTRARTLDSFMDAMTPPSTSRSGMTEAQVAQRRKDAAVMTKKECADRELLGGGPCSEEEFQEKFDKNLKLIMPTGAGSRRATGGEKPMEWEEFTPAQQQRYLREQPDVVKKYYPEVWRRHIGVDSGE